MTLACRQDSPIDHEAGPGMGTQNSAIFCGLVTGNDGPIISVVSTSPIVRHRLILYRLRGLQTGG
jgi:hypothetical protein